MNTTLRNAFKKAEDKHCESIIALQAIDKHLAFSGFRGNEPKISMAAGDDILLVWQGKEMDKETIIEIMESRGYITPDDFVGVFD